MGIGGTGTLAGVDGFALKGDSLQSLATWQRLLLLGGVLLVSSVSLIGLLRLQGWRHFAALVIYGLVVLLLLSLLLPFTLLEIWDGYSEILAIIVLLLFLPVYGAGWLSAWLLYRSVRQAHHISYPVAFAFAGEFAGAFAFAFAFAFAGAVAFAFAGAGAGAGAGAVAFAVAVAGAVAFAGAGAVAFAFAGAFAGAFAVLMRASQDWARQRGLLAWFWLLYSGLLVLLSFSSLLWIAHKNYLMLLLFWLWLPLLNAGLDWFSLGVTRGLLQAVRLGNHSAARALGWAIADLLLALVFLVLITSVLLVVVALANATVGQPLVPLTTLLQDVHKNAAGVNNGWIYFMLLSTLVPTLIHFALAGGAATLWLPKQRRSKVVDGIEASVFKHYVAWAYLIFTPFIGFMVAPALLLYY